MASGRSGTTHSEIMTGLVLVLAMHVAVLYGLWSYRLIPEHQDAVAVFVNFINPPPVEKKLEAPLPPPKPVKRMKPRPVTAPPMPVLVAEAPVLYPAEPVAPMPEAPVLEVEAPPESPEPAPTVEAPPAPPETVMLTSDLAVACPQRVPPEYPAISRRKGEEGRVLLRVDLDETGRISSIKIKESSGFKRLDEAGLTAVRQWHCTAPTRDGRAVKAVALQPFNFVLEGHQ